MTFMNIVYIACALSFDAVAVSAANGAAHHRMSHTKALQIALCFGFFQFLMPILGWTIGMGFQDMISEFGYWVAFALLVVLGIRMIMESLKSTDEKSIDIHNTKTLLVLSIATSIDAMIVGMTFALLPINIWQAAIVIGIVTFVFSLLSVYIGKKSGERWGKKAEILGGIILISIGIKILLGHLFF